MITTLITAVSLTCACYVLTTLVL